MAASLGKDLIVRSFAAVVCGASALPVWAAAVACGVLSSAGWADPPAMPLREQARRFLSVYLEAAPNPSDAPLNVDAVGRVAWLLATHDDARFRDGQAAMLLADWVAERDFTHLARTQRLQAAACAECGDFSRAERLLRAARDSQAIGNNLSGEVSAEHLESVARRMPLRECAPAPSDSASGPLGNAVNLVAADLLRAAQYADALRLLKALPLSAASAASELLQSRALRGLGELGASSDVLAVAAARRPQAIALRLELAWRQQEQGRFEEAIANYRRVLSLEVGQGTAVNNLAWLFATCPDPKVRDGQAALDILSVSPAAREDANRLDTQAAAEAALGRFAEAERYAAAAENRARAEGRLELAREIAWRRCGYGVGRAFTEGDPVPRELAAPHLRHAALANELMRRERFEEALRHAVEALRGDPEGAEPWIRAARLQMRCGRSAEAAALAAHACRLARDDSETRRLLAWILATSPNDDVRSPAAALRHARKASALQPDEWSNWDTLAVALSAAGSRAEAVEAWDRSAALANRRTPEALPALAQRRQACLEGLAYREPSVGPASSAALISAWEELGLLALDDEAWQEAQDSFARAEAAASTAPSPVKLRLAARRATALEQGGRTAEALAALRAAAAQIQEPTDAAAELANNLAALLIRDAATPLEEVRDAERWAARAVAWRPDREAFRATLDEIRRRATQR